MNIQQKLSDRLRPFESAPFLFVGSGLSRRYIHLDTWQGLLQRFAANLSQPFEYYYTSAGGDLPEVAALLSNDFYERWWREEEYESSRKTYSKQLKNKHSCFKVEVSKYIEGQKYVHGQDEQLDQEVTLLKKATIDGIITTNWDSFLESSFPDFRTYIGQESVLFANPQGIAEIYKIHGCATAPDSLVLTDEDYRVFDARNPYLAAKLLTIFVEHPVVFLGYSLSDPNILKILKSLSACLSTDNLDKLKDRLVFVQWNNVGGEPGFETTVVQSSEGPLPVTLIRTDTFKQVPVNFSVKRQGFCTAGGMGLAPFKC